MFFSKGLRIGRIGGVTIGVDYTWFIIFFLLVYLLGAVIFPQLVQVQGLPAYSAGWYWLTAVITSLFFFGSVLAHELSHAAVARRSGIPVNAITLFIFGGVAQMEDEPGTAWDEFKMAIAGPLASFAIGGVFIVLFFVSAGTLTPLVTLAFYYLGFINLVLGAFNLLPGFPLDGGRVFRAAMWRITGNLRTATRIASVTGQFFGWVFIIAGVASVFYAPIRAYVNIWIALIGWFLVSAARSSYQQLVMKEELSKVPVTALMTPDVEAVPATITLDHLVADYLLRDNSFTLPVEKDGDLVGMVSVEDVRAVPREEWPSKLVTEVMHPLADEQVLHPNSDAWDAANRMAQANSDRMIVTEDGRVEGVVTRNAIMRWLESHVQLAHGHA